MKKITNSLLYTIAVIAAIYLLSSCSGRGYTSAASYTGLYDFELQTLHPSVVLYFRDADTLEAYFRINTEELLYARQNPEEQFRSNINISALLKDDKGSRILDSTSIKIHDFSIDKSAKLLIGSIKLAAKDTLKGILELKISDLLKGSSQQVIKYFDKSNPNAQSNFLLIDKKNNSPVFGYAITSPTEIEIHSRFSNQNTCWIRNFSEGLNLPPPPFSYTSPEDYKLENANESRELTLNNGKTSFFAMEGVYFISRNANSESGISLEVRQASFPEVNTVSELVKTLRYISSRAEYESMTSASNPKLLLDKFWLDCTGNKDKARELIKIYYRRVREANYYFSCHLEGWKTDRGLVHIVFGNPNKIYRNFDQEVWLYGEENNLTSVSFTFRKTPSPFAENYYRLSRDPIYKTSWSRAVDSWRNGRIFNE